MTDPTRNKYPNRGVINALHRELRKWGYVPETERISDDEALAIAARLTDAQLRAMRQIGRESLAWIRAHQP